MPRKKRVNGWLYGTYLTPDGERLQAEMPAADFIGFIYAVAGDKGRNLIMKEIAKQDQRRLAKKNQ